MKKYILSALISLCTISALGQVYPIDLHYKVVKNYEGWKKGQEVHLTQIRHTVETYPTTGAPALADTYYLYEEGSKAPHQVKSRFDGAMSCSYECVKDIWDDVTIANVLVMIQKKGTQVDMRAEMEEDAIDFINKMTNNGAEFADPYLENYVYSLVAKIAPKTLIDGRPGNVNIIIVTNDVPNAFTFANGTIVLTTGLITALHTEDELVAVLSHEIAHFVLDHSVQNVNDAIKRQKRAEFWASMATVATAVAEGVAASKNDYYVPGAATASMAVLSFGIANQVVDHLGMKYNHQQENEADMIAKEVLRVLGYDENALALALYRLQLLNESERSLSSYFESYTHPSLSQRISRLGTHDDIRNADFEKMISFAVTTSAIQKYSNRRFRQVLPLVEQNIANHVATADDYILQADCMLALNNTEESNLDVLKAVEIAKELDNKNINIYKAEIIAYLRLKRITDAQQLLKDYHEKLGSMYEELKTLPGGSIWNGNYNFIMKERTWAEHMIVKLNGM